MAEEKKVYVCRNCGWLYDPEKGDPDHGIKAGTAFDDIPDTWRCPVCNVRKTCFDCKDWHGFNEFDQNLCDGKSGMIGQ